MKWWNRQHLFVQIAIGAVIGIVLGLFLGENVRYVSPLGEIFLRLLQMLIVPLTFFVLIDGIINLSNLKQLRTIGGITIGYYMVTTAVASSIGIVIALLFNPGKRAEGLLLDGKEVEVNPEEFNFIDNLIQWIPNNILSGMVEVNMLQIIITAIIIGVALLSLGDKVEGINKLIKEGATLMLTITSGLMKIAPIGIMALIADLVGTTDLTIIFEALYYVLSALVGLAFLLFVFYPLIIKFLTDFKPLNFFRTISSTLLIAAATSSSNATLPSSMDSAKKLGISERIYGFTLPLGATINMDGLALTFGVTGVFAANLYGIPITITLILQFIFLGLALSMGTAGVRGADIVIMGILMSTLGLPLELVAVYAAVSPLVDAGNTTNNIAGDLTGTAFVHSRLKNKLEDIAEYKEKIV